MHDEVLDVLPPHKVHKLQHRAVEQVVARPVGGEGSHDGREEAVLYDVTIVELVLKPHASTQEAHRRHHQVFLTALRQVKHLLHHIVTQHVVLNAEAVMLHAEAEQLDGLHKGPRWHRRCCRRRHRRRRAHDPRPCRCHRAAFAPAPCAAASASRRWRLVPHPGGDRRHEAVHVGIVKELQKSALLYRLIHGVRVQHQLQ
mmetsp:Transcript_19649/g.48650  ORF Transcript_19649/g.48650 Transcript_19649/m.48650 type:complete len:200 (+) Transcript_19649:2977-3576(+)